MEYSNDMEVMLDAGYISLFMVMY